MPTSNSDFFVKYGLDVAGKTNIAGNTVISANLTVSNTITTTDSAAQHSIVGNVAFNTDTLIIDRGGKRVSIAGAPSTSTLTVTGTAKVTDGVSFDKNLSVGGDLNVTKNVTVAGDSSVAKFTATGDCTVKNLTIASGGSIVLLGNPKDKTGGTVDGVDVSELFATIQGAAILRVYDVNGKQLFPN